MKGDFTRSTFKPASHYSSVRKQQGRVEIDADWNEQADIQTHRQETAAKDIIGPCGAPLAEGGFAVGVKTTLLRSVFFTDDSHGWAAGGDGAILATTDRGAAWTRQMPLARIIAALRAVHFVSALKGWAVGDEGTILSTADGGATWIRQFPPAGTGASLNSVHFVSPDEGWIVGEGALILATANGGATWSQQAAPEGIIASLNGVHFTDASTGRAVGEGGIILATSDGGETWTRQSPPSGFSDTLNAVRFAGAGVGWTVGDNAGILATTDGGTTWTQQSSPTAAVSLRAIFLTDASHGWAVGDNAAILATSDGTSWADQAAPTGVASGLHGVAFADASHGWAVGENSTLLATTDGGTTWAAQKAPDDLSLSPGRLYVDGILCECEAEVSYLNQPDLPAAEAIAPSANGSRTDIVYLDVWQRHITALEDPPIREVALGGPDTATRAKTVWQVRRMAPQPIDDGLNCLSSLPEWDALTAGSTGMMSARARPGDPADSPCVVPPGAGYRRLENQLYRVEIHSLSQTGEATFKWSRENGSIVTGWLAENGDDLTVASSGRDRATGFASGDWIELIDDTHELNGLPGTLVQVLRPEGDVLTIDPATATGPVSRASFPRNPRIRRWDSPGAAAVEIPADNDGWLPLEEGIEIRFEPGVFRPGDYWTIPARTATGDIEWPTTPACHPLPQPPEGIRHHYCRLALIEVTAQGLRVLSDCRPLFPALTEMVSLFYIGGDGQEAMPGADLSQPLEVGVSNGEWPVAGAQVEFRCTASGGTVRAQEGDAAALTVITVATDIAGVARCFWRLDAANDSQQVEAVLKDAAGQPAHLPVRFNANLSVARQVAYDPSACENLAQARTVQEAIDLLCQAEHRDPGIHIEGIEFLATGNPLRNDTEVVLDELIKGIRVICDRTPDIQAIRDKPVCRVALEIPFPMTPQEMDFWNTSEVIGYNLLILDADTAADEKQILWFPDNALMQWLNRLLAMMVELKRGSRVLAHLTLKGNFIWDIEDPELYLDGEAFGIRAANGATDLRLPGGDGRAGGDFEMWFWLVRGKQRAIGLIPFNDSDLFKRPGLGRAINLALDRGHLAGTLPGDYQADFSQPFSIERANAIVAGMDLPRRDILTVVDSRFALAGEHAKGMIAALNLNMEIVPGDDAVETVRRAMATGQRIDMVLSDEETADRLGQTFPDRFGGVAVRF
ncbi:MAG: hypothetical protein IT210_13260 [Armatimonadetes bacterium]|nr:hypothetical protein [Armatimonadota bacterium]